MTTTSQKKAISLGQTVIVDQLITTRSHQIDLKLGEKGLVRALKLTAKNLKLVMIEFKDHSRIWFFEQEVKLIEQMRNSQL
nr:Ycf86 [Erythrotrichia foliiformis]